MEKSNNMCRKATFHWTVAELQVWFMSFADSQVLLIHARAVDVPLLFALEEADGPAEQVVFLKVFQQTCFCKNAGISGLRP